MADLVILPPPEYRGTPGQWREPAGYRVTARGRLWPGRVDLETVTVTDRDTGASLTVPMATGVAGGWVSASLPTDLAPDALARLWRDGRYLVGWAGSQVGRRPETDERIAEIVRTAAALGDRPTRQRVAEELGKVDGDGQVHSGYKRDVKAAGGWAEIIRRAAELRRGGEF